MLSVLLVYLLYAVIRRSPRRWWFYFWLVSLPIIAGLMYLEPMVIEPMFYHFDPLAAKQPALVAQLEKVVARGGLAIPQDRMFEMQASEKLNSLNAYVSGFGGSKRVVVWDTTINKMTTPEILFVFGHEMGHYVLHHVRDSLILGSLLLLAAAVHRISRIALAGAGARGEVAHPRCRRLGFATGAAVDRRGLVARDRTDGQRL